uniref:Lipase_3 domain-containing protein n=1 Tax=Ascaris lumbricoides TaxID=6252 RepID=A0A0M3HXU6_ASCLU
LAFSFQCIYFYFQRECFGYLAHLPVHRAAALVFRGSTEEQVFGHSTASGFASIASAQLSVQGYVRKDKIKLITFGQPRMSDALYAQNHDRLVGHASNHLVIRMIGIPIAKKPHFPESPINLEYFMHRCLSSQIVDEVLRIKMASSKCRLLEPSNVEIRQLQAEHLQGAQLRNLFHLIAEEVRENKS